MKLRDIPLGMTLYHITSREPFVLLSCQVSAENRGVAWCVYLLGGHLFEDHHSALIDDWYVDYAWEIMPYQISEWEIA